MSCGWLDCFSVSEKAGVGRKAGRFMLWLAVIDFVLGLCAFAAWKALNSFLECGVIGVWLGKGLAQRGVGR